MKWSYPVSTLGSLIFAIIVFLVIANPIVLSDSTSDVSLYSNDNLEPIDQYEQSAFSWYTDSLFDNVSAYLYDANEMTIDAEFGDWSLPNSSCSVHPKFYCDTALSATMHFRWDPDEYLLMAWVTIFDLNVMEPSSHGFLFALIVRYPDGFIHAQQITVTNYEGRGFSTNFADADYDDSSQYPMLEIAYELQRPLSPGDELGIIALYEDEYSGIADPWPKYTDGGSGPDSIDTETMAKLILQPDYENPDVDLTSPVSEGLSYYTTESSVMLNWDASDNYHIDYFDIEVDSVTEESGLVSTSTSYLLTGLTEGSHSVSVRCYDESGRYSTSSIIIVVDNTAPSVTFTNPVDFFNASSTSVTIDWLASDSLSWVASQDILINDTTEATGLSGSSDTYLLSLSSGYHNVTIVSWDGVGNYGIDTIFIRVDVTAPVVSFTTPLDSDYLSSDFVTVQWTIQDAIPTSTIQTTWIYLDDGLDTTASGPLTQKSWTLSEGAHNVTVVSIDYSGNYGRDVLIFYVDLTNPLVEITHPPDGLELSNGSYTFILTWTSSDNLGTDYIEIWIESSLADTLSGDADNYFPPTITDTTAYTVRVYDFAGRFSSDSVVVSFLHLDTTPPSVTITSHLNYSWDSSTLLLQWSANDPETGVSSIHIRLDDNPLTDQTFAGAATQTALDMVTEGLHKINITAVNGDGFSATVILWINSDDTAPYLNILNPLDESIHLLDTITATWDMHDNVSGTPGIIDRVEVYLDSDLETITSSMSQVISPLDSGHHTLELRVYDLAGNMQSESVEFWVDLTPPDVTFVSPTDDFTYDKYSVNEVLIRVLNSDDTDIILVYVRIENATVISINQTMTYNGVSGYWEYTWGLSSFAPDSYNITIICMDLGGRISLEEIKGEIIHTGPPLDITPPSLSILSPINGTYTQSGLTISWNAQDPESDIAYTEVRVDGVIVVSTINLVDSFYLSLVTEGPHVVSISVRNGVDLWRNRTLTIFLDTVSPWIQIASPLNGHVFETGSFSLIWDAHDDNGTCGLLDHFVIYHNGLLLVETESFSYNLVNLEEGTHQIRVVAFDAAGNSASALTAVYVDSTPPIVSIIAPLAEFKVKPGFVDTIQLVCLVTDTVGAEDVIAIILSSVSSYNVSIDLSLNHVTGTWESNWNLDGAPLGAYTISFIALDIGNHTGLETIQGSLIPLDIVDGVTLFFENPVYRAITATVALLGTIWGGWKLIRKYKERPKKNLLSRMKEI